MADEKGPAKKRPAKSKAKNDSAKKGTQYKDNPVAGGPRDPGEPNPPDLHREYVEQRTGGGAPPTRQAYDNALAQWRKLPGAVIGVARDVRPVTETPEEQLDDPKDESNQDEQPDDPKGESSQKE